MGFTDDEYIYYGVFIRRHELNDDEREAFGELYREGMKYKTCEKTILAARARTAEKAAAKAVRAEVAAHFTSRYRTTPQPHIHRPRYLVRVSPEMRNFLRLKDEPIRQDYVHDRMREYFRTNNLYNPADVREIKADVPLQKLLKIHDHQLYSIFRDIGKRISAHCTTHTTAVAVAAEAVQERQLKKKLNKLGKKLGWSSGITREELVAHPHATMAKQKHMKHAHDNGAAAEDAKKRKQTRVAFWAAAADNAQKRKHKALQVSHDLMVDTVEAPESEPAIKPSVIKPNKAIMLPEPRWRRHPVPSSQGHVPEIKSPIPELKYHGWF